MVGNGDVLGGAANLHHLGAGRAFQHPVTNHGRLQHAVTGVHEEGFALAFIDHPDPALAAKNHLKPDLVEMHIVRHQPALQDADVRCNEGAAMALGQQVAVAQTGAPNTPGGLCIGVVDDQGLLGFGQLHGRVGPGQLNAHAIGGDQLARALRHVVRVVTQQAQAFHAIVSATDQLEAQPMAGQDGRAGAVGGVDGLNAKAQALHKK